MMEQQTGNRKQETEMFLVKKPVARAVVVRSVREGSTGQVVCIAPERATLHRVWAVAEVRPVRESVHPAQDDATDRNGPPQPEVAFYRKYTEALLRRYLRLATQTGRIPSLMSRDVFRGNVSHYRVSGFEDVVIFCCDVEQRLAKLNPGEQQLIKRVAMQRYTLPETAAILGIGLTPCKERYSRAIDRLTGLLLEVGLLDLTRR